MNDATTALKMVGADAGAARDRNWILLWAFAVLLLYAAFGYYGVRALRDYAAQARIAQATLVAPEAAPAGATPPRVRVGARLNRIADVALAEGAWTADFTIWFRWDDPALNPGKDFSVVDGQIVQQDRLASAQRGSTRYEEYHVVARIAQSFDAMRFPFGEEVALVRIEDKLHGLDRLGFEVDERNSGVAHDAMPPNADLIQPFVSVRSRVAAPGSADALSEPANARSRSQFIFGAVLEPKGLDIALRLFQALLVSVAVAMLALFIKPVMIDCRFGLPIGAFFASVSNNAVVSAVVPRSAGRTLSDMITTLSLLTIFLVLVQSVIALYVFDTQGRERLARKFDHVSFVVILLGYLIVSVVLPLVAQAR